MPIKTGTKNEYFTRLDQIEQLSKQEMTELMKVTDKFPFRGNKYYLSLIDWKGPNDPIRTAIIPHLQELEEWGRRDPSDEKTHTIMAGLEHKYNSTALLLVSTVCGGVCRYCFRKRIFLKQ